MRSFFPALLCFLLILCAGCGCRRFFYRSVDPRSINVHSMQRVEHVDQSVNVSIKRVSRTEIKALFGHYGKHFNKMVPGVVVFHFVISNNGRAPLFITPLSIPFPLLQMHNRCIESTHSFFSRLWQTLSDVLRRTRAQNQPADQHPLFWLDISRHLTKGKVVVKAQEAATFLMCAYEKDIPEAFSIALFDQMNAAMRFSFSYMK